MRKETLSRRLYVGLRQSILSGAYRPGDRLPSTRDLAERNGQSRTVVLAAYEQLLAEGFVEGRRGAYVSEGLRTSPSKPTKVLTKVSLSRFGSLAVSRSGL
jgi:GntR family transcriptional regulator/MocR family aminotransferase